MTEAEESPIGPETVADLPHLGEALDDDRFRQFLDHVPFGVAVAELASNEVLVYANLEFERLIGIPAEDLQGKPWSSLPLVRSASGDQDLATAIVAGEEYLGTFATSSPTEPQWHIDAWSNTIVNDAGTPLFRLVAIANTNIGQTGTDVATTLAEKDVLLKELQHRVKNNLCFGVEY